MAACFGRAISAAPGSMPMSGCFSMRRWSLRSIRANHPTCWSAPISASSARAMGGGAGVRKRATSFSARYLRSRSRRTVSERYARRRAASSASPAAGGRRRTPRTPRSRRGPSLPVHRTIVSICSAEAGCSPARTAGRPMFAVPGLPQTERDDRARSHPEQRRRSWLRSSTARSMTSQDGGRTWRDGGLGRDGGAVDTVAPDAYAPDRIWAASADRLHSATISAPLGVPSGARCLSPGRRCAASPRDADGNDAGRHHRPRHLSERERRCRPGFSKRTIFRSTSRRGRSPATRATRRLIYAVYSLMPYSEVWRAANRGRQPARAHRSDQPRRRHLVLSAYPDRRRLRARSGWQARDGADPSPSSTPQ